jgi:hypothetical protein
MRSRWKRIGVGEYQREVLGMNLSVWAHREKFYGAVNNGGRVTARTADACMEAVEWKLLMILEKTTKKLYQSLTR